MCQERQPSLTLPGKKSSFSFMNETPKVGLLFYTGKGPMPDLSSATMPPVAPRKPAVEFLEINLGQIVIALAIVFLGLCIYFRP